MHVSRPRTIQTARGLAFGFALAVLFSSAIGTLPASAGLIDYKERRPWSDLSYQNIDSGGFVIGTKTLTIIANSEANTLELGNQYGPPPAPNGRHYGPLPADFGGAMITTLTVSNAIIETDGSVLPGNGGLVRVIYNGPPAGSGNLASDYGLVNGSVLLEGTVLRAKLDPAEPGANTMNILFSIVTGKLQEANTHNGLVFAPAELGMMHIAGLTLPSDFSASFSLSGGGETIDVYGIPEPGSVVLGLVGAMFVFSGRSRRRFFCEP